MMGFVTRRVIPSRQLYDVHLSELTEQMETLWISSHKHTHTLVDDVVHCRTRRYKEKERSDGVTDT